MAAASGSFGFGDKVAAALREAQEVLNQNPLSAAVKLQPSTSDVEASLDRTEKAAKDAASTMGTGGSTSAAAPLVAQDKLIEVMQALVNAITDDAKARGGSSGEGGGKPKGPPKPPGGPEDEGKPGYMNPYALQALMNNPLGFAQQSGYSMLSGGAGGGLKAPEWMQSLLGGENGLHLGRALAAPVGGPGGLGGGFLAGPVAAALPPLALVAGAKIGWGIGQSISNTYDETAAGQFEDYKLSRRLGFDFRGDAYGPDRFQSHTDIALQDVRGVLASMDVGLSGSPSNRAYRAESINKMMVNLGLSGAEGGSMVGAMIRSGGASNMDQGIVLLDKIAKGVEDAARAGWSTPEGMRTFAGFQASTAAASGGVVTAEAAIRNAGLMDALSATGAPELRGQNGVANIAAAGQITSPNQRAFLMGGLLQMGPNGTQVLSKHGQDMVALTYSPQQIAAARKALGPLADTMLASGVLDDTASATVEKSMHMGQGAFSAFFLGGTDVTKAATLQETADIVKSGGLESAIRRVRTGASDAASQVVGVGGSDASRREAEGAYASRTGKQVDTISGITDDLAAGFRDGAKWMSLQGTRLSRFADAYARANADTAMHPLDPNPNPIGKTLQNYGKP